MGARMEVVGSNVFRTFLQIGEEKQLNVTAVADAAASSLSFGSWPDWAGVVVAVIAVVVSMLTLNQLVVLIARFPENDKSNAIKFVTMLCDQMWECTNRITSVFAQRLREPPGDLVAMRIHVRHLREDLSIPMTFIAQMRAHPPGDWHDAGIFKAFTNWSAQVAAMAQQLDDLHQAITYPVVREPVDKHNEAMLVYQYHTEHAFLDRRVDDVAGRAYEFCAVAAKFLTEARKKADKGGVVSTTHDCPCCKRTLEQHRYIQRDPLRAIVLPAPPAPPPTSMPKPVPTPPVPVSCMCVMPHPCICYRRCSCACLCTPALVAPAPPAKAAC